MAASMTPFLNVRSVLRCEIECVLTRSVCPWGAGSCILVVLRALLVSVWLAFRPHFTCECTVSLAIQRDAAAVSNHLQVSLEPPLKRSLSPWATRHSMAQMRQKSLLVAETGVLRTQAFLRRPTQTFGQPRWLSLAMTAMFFSDRNAPPFSRGRRFDPVPGVIPIFFVGIAVSFLRPVAVNGPSSNRGGSAVVEKRRSVGTRLGYAPLPLQKWHLVAEEAVLRNRDGSTLANKKHSGAGVAGPRAIPSDASVSGVSISISPWDPNQSFQLASVKKVALTPPLASPTALLLDLSISGL